MKIFQWVETFHDRKWRRIIWLVQTGVIFDIRTTKYFDKNSIALDFLPYIFRNWISNIYSDAMPIVRFLTVSLPSLSVTVKIITHLSSFTGGSDASLILTIIWTSPDEFECDLSNRALNFLFKLATSPCRTLGIFAVVGFGFNSSNWHDRRGVTMYSRYSESVTWRSYSQIYSINKFSTNKPGRSFSRTGPNVRLRVWFMFGLRIWALTTSNNAWHMCWSLFLSSSVVFWPVPDSTKKTFVNAPQCRGVSVWEGWYIQIVVPGAICWRTFSHLYRIWRVTWWFPKIISRSDFIFVISCLNRVISCVFCEFGLRFASCSRFAII